MPAPRHLRNAPITEAIVDLRVKSRAGFQAKEFAELAARLKERFPKVEERRGIVARLEVRPGDRQASELRDLGLRGYFFKTEDEKTIAQFRVDGFTFNRLRPYTSWEELFPVAMDLWRTYRACANPETVIRLAVRYINHVPLPPEATTFEPYLRAAPVIPPELPQNVRSFLTRVTIYDPITDAAAHIAQALEPNPTARGLTILLDIDAYQEGEFRPDDPAIEEAFGRLRVLKNQIFFGSITEIVLRQFE